MWALHPRRNGQADKLGAIRADNVAAAAAA